MDANTRQSAQQPPPKRFGFFYDFDLTLSTEFQQEPILRRYFAQLQKKYGIEQPLDYFRLCDDADLSVGYLNHMLEDAELFEGLTDQRLRDEFGPQIKLAPNIPAWFSQISNYCKEQGYAAEHHVLSLGLLSLIQGTPVADNVSSIQGAEFLEKDGRIVGIKNAISPFRKVEYIKPICKGAPLHQDVALKDYAIRYSNCFVFGDGQSDKDMFRFIKQRGGVAIAVYEPGNKRQYDALALELGGSVHYIVPRDYSLEAEIAGAVCRSVSLRKESNCTMDYEIVYKMLLNHLENKQVQEIAKNHLSGCELCKDRGLTKQYFR